MNFLQKFTLEAMGGLSFKGIGTQAPMVSSGRDGTPVLQAYSVQTAVERDLKKNPFLYSALTKKADAISTVPFYVEELKGGVWRRVEGHPAEYLIEGANPFISGSELKKLLVYHKDLSGSSYLQIVLNSRNQPIFLQPLFPQYMRVIPSADMFIEGFEYTINGVRVDKFSPDEIVWTKHPDPGDPYRGLSPLQALKGELESDLSAREWNRISMNHRGATDVAFIMRDVVTEDDYKLVRKMIEDRYSGPQNARRPWIVGGNSDVRPMSYTAVEMDYINTRKFNREVVSAALGVPAPLIGDADNSTYNNLDTLKQEFWQGTLTNYLESIRQDLNRQVLYPYFGDGRRRSPQLRYMYDLSGIEALQGNMLEKAEIAKTMKEAGFSIEHINTYLGYDFDDPAAIEAEETETPPDDAEERASFVLQEILAKNPSREAFQAVISELHNGLAVKTGKTPNDGYARKRASDYLELGLDQESLAKHIASSELRLVA